MKPQTAAYLDAAHEALSDARGNLSIKIFRQAARLSYYAQFHAAQALIFERTDKKTHKGVSHQFHKLAKTEPTFPSNLAAQLATAYHYKEIADYDTGASPPITFAVAQGAIATAERFVATIRQALAASPPTPAAP